MEVGAYKKDGSNRHIKGCERAIESLKFEIRGLNARHRGRMVEQNNSANEPSSSGNVRLTEEDREIEQAFPGSILGDSAGTPSACFHNSANNLPLKPMMDAAQREKADRLWAMAQQVAGLPFRVFSHPAFQEAYNFSSQFPGYKFPGEKKLRGPLLDANYQAVKEETEKKMFQKLIWDKITISCDGWTNVSGRPQMNILDVNRFGEAVHCHVDGSNEVKSGVWIAGHIKKAIEERGHENVLQFVADNASANTLAGKLVRDTYPHVIFGGCVAHGLDLLMEDIGKLDWVKSVVIECKTFIQFVKNHHMPHAMFLDHFSNGASLLKPAATRFATNCIMLDRAYTLKGPLSRMVISNRWRNWLSNPSRPANVRKGPEHLKTTVLDDEFWDKITDEDLRQYLRSMDRELDGIACMDTSIWTQSIRRKLCLKNAEMLQCFGGRKRGAEYGSTANPRDAWIPDEVLEATGPEIGLSTGERVRIKTWDWTEPVSEDEVLDDKLQESSSRDNHQRDGQSESNVDPVENVIYYDDIGDHDFPNDSALQVEDPMVLPGMEIGEEDGLDDYYNISSNWIDQDSIARYTTVDAIDTRKARALGVPENQVVELNKKFGNRLFPKSDVERSPTREDDRGLGRNVSPRSTDDSSLPRGETSLPTAEPSSPGGETSSPGGETSSPRADNSSPRARTLRNLPVVDYRIQLNPPNVFR
ncbi:hypothetical protein R1sor_003600 [Riccia sorocarpa]|uniref:DUF659 domain-containing protein n=1 Tax=Riccia sorocarpa TaxID=122646 RepID=A0ABD3H220_9MARC